MGIFRYIAPIFLLVPVTFAETKVLGPAVYDLYGPYIVGNYYLSAYKSREEIRSRLSRAKSVTTYGVDYGYKTNWIFVKPSPNFIDRTYPVYSINTHSDLSKSRMIESTAYYVETEYELRQVLSSLNKKPAGYLYINAFDIMDGWSQHLGYKEIEQIVVATNSRHADIGVCWPHFKTAFAVSPTVEEMKSLFLGNSITATTYCASIGRLKKLKLMKLYETGANHVFP